MMKHMSCLSLSFFFTLSLFFLILMVTVSLTPFCFIRSLSHVFLQALSLFISILSPSLSYFLLFSFVLFISSFLSLPMILCSSSSDFIFISFPYPFFLSLPSCFLPPSFLFSLSLAPQRWRTGSCSSAWCRRSAMRTTSGSCSRRLDRSRSAGSSEGPTDSAEVRVCHFDLLHP